MSFKGKVLVVIITIFCVMFLQKSILAVDLVYQAIFNYTNTNERYIVYRTVVKPHSSTLDNEQFSAYNTWYEGITNAEPTWATYKSNYLIFTKNKIGQYASTNSNTGVGYAAYSVKEEGYDMFYSGSAEAVANWVENFAVRASVKNVIVGDNSAVFGNTPLYTYGNDENGVPVAITSNLSSENIEKYNANTIPNVGNSVMFPYLFSDKTDIIGGEKWVRPAPNSYYVSGVVDWKTKRCMLYTSNPSLASKVPSASDNSSEVYYIMDILLDTETTNQLYNYKENNEDETIYVSGISETMNTYYNPTKFYMLTPGAWLYSKVRRFDGKGGWSNGTLGITDDGLNAGLNLWDNELLIPVEEKQDKRIIVNHIAVDVDSDGKESFSLIASSQDNESNNKEVMTVDEETLTAKNANSNMYNKIDTLYLNGDKTLTTSVGKNLDKMLRSKGTIENGMTQYKIRAPKSNTDYKVNELVKLNLGYKYVGGVVDVDTKIDSLNDENYIASYFSKEYDVVKMKQEKNIEFKISDDNVTEVIVNLYYKEETKNVKVANKVCTDAKNQKECIYVEGNRELKATNPNTKDTKTLNWTGVSFIEEYVVNKKYNISVDSISNNVYKYKGYIVKYGNTVLENWNNPATTYATNIEQDLIVEFYYERTTSTVTPSPSPNPTPNQLAIVTEHKDKPSIDISGTLTVQSAVNVSTTCEDYYSVPTNAKNSTNDVYVGIKNTPTYILAGINVKEKTEDNNRNVTINVKISFGRNSKTWTIKVPYSLSYYAIQELLIYKYENVEIYNAGEKNTTGDLLFNKDKLTITPKNTSTLILNGAANSNISYRDMNNWKNYLVTSFKTNYAIPNYNPDDYVENASDRTNKSFALYWGHGYSGGNYKLPDKKVDNSVSEYITTELAEQYTNIQLNGSTTISIELLSIEVFDSIDKNGDREITLDDLEKLANETDSKEKVFEAAKNELGKAEAAYLNECIDGRYGFPCKSEVEAAYGVERTACRDSICTDSEGNERSCKCNKEDCSSCYKSKNLYNSVNKLASTWSTKKSAYNDALDDLEEAYEAELDAIKHYDEAYYIQKNIWKVYKDMDNEDIAKLIKLDVKFDYSSGNAKLGNTDLMIVKKHVLELKSDDTKALNGQLVGDNCEKQVLVASRQTMSNTQKQYYVSGIAGASWLPNERNAVSSTYYNNNAYEIPITRLNGTRVLAGKAKYQIDSTNKVGKSTVVQDNMYYDIKKDENTITETVFEVKNTSSFTKEYGVTQNIEVKEKQKTNTAYNSGNVSSEEFNVYTPLVVTAKVNQDIDIIDQTSTNKYSGIDVIQSNSTFTINFYNNKDRVYANNNSKPSDFTSRYKQVTYIKFEFAVTNLKYIGKNGVGSYGSKNANEWIGPIYGDYITAVPYLNTTQGESVTDQTYKYYVIAAAVNIDESWTKQLLDYINTSLDDLKEDRLIEKFKNACGYEGKYKLSYYADVEGQNGEKGGTLIIVNRMYDFRVTDLKDLDWKDVFRNNTSSSYVNKHSGIAYYAGLNKWNTKNPIKYNQIIGRTQDEIGTSPSRILPLGPYKNTDTSYISAPKMGYRFSFDFKVTGAVDDNKYVKITPSFYYISKYGKVFYPEYSSGKEGIYLFYKNSNGEYVRVGSSNDTYKIQFTPNDGYRSLVQTDIKNLNANVVTLGSLTSLRLNFKETTTTSKNDAAITYYGEYKLPNSTIAVYVDKNGKYDINKPLTDGYIGVVFDIQAHETSGVDLVYGKNSYKNLPNTSQWDYEGYLGISEPGKAYSTTIKLEKGTWKIDNATYNKIKGTVILYDTDSRASNDFN